MEQNKGQLNWNNIHINVDSANSVMVATIDAELLFSPQYLRFLDMMHSFSTEVKKYHAFVYLTTS